MLLLITSLGPNFCEIGVIYLILPKGKQKLTQTHGITSCGPVLEQIPNCSLFPVHSNASVGVLLLLSEHEHVWRELFIFPEFAVAPVKLCTLRILDK